MEICSLVIIPKTLDIYKKGENFGAILYQKNGKTKRLFLPIQRLSPSQLGFYSSSQGNQS